MPLHLAVSPPDRRPAFRSPHRRARRGRRGRAGHTLVELVVVITVGMILMAVVTPRLNRAAYDADAAARVVRGTLQTAQRVAVAQQADVVVGFDVPNQRLRVLEDLNGNGRWDQNARLRERVTWRPLAEGGAVRFAAPPERVRGGGNGNGNGNGNNGNAGNGNGALADAPDLVDGLPSLTFRRDGAASGNAEVYLRAVRGRETEWRAVVVARATGRVERWARPAGGPPAWARRGQ